MKWFKKRRFEVKPFINGTGWMVWDKLMFRIYKAFETKTEAIILRNYLNKTL